jgi:2-octaprenyl-6-methoxyphenol hydroxylase
MRDVAVVGAGPVGATFALALRHADLDVVVLDARPAGVAARADRSLALSHGARLILERLGAWTPLAGIAGAVTPIIRIDISQARGFGSVELTASEQGLPALGYVVSYRALQSALDAALAVSGIDVRFGHEAREVNGAADRATVDLASGGLLYARLAVVADGAAAAVRGIARKRHDYGQTAIVAEVALDHPHRGIAYERFTAAGPVALLPERDHYALVWTQAPEAAARALALPDTEFLSALATHFGSRVRGFTGVRERRMFPLTLEVARDTTAARVAVIGNAAQALHPIAGQGFNLGLRDAFELAALVRGTPRDALGGGAMLARYRAARRLDRRAGIAFTHGLTQLFASDAPAIRVPRGLGMMLLDSVPVAKRAFTRAMLYGARW